MVAGSIAMHTITFVAIRIQKFQATPQILHDRDPEVNPRHSRHNKAIVSRHSVWQFLLLYFLVVVLLLLLGSAKGTTLSVENEMKNIYLYALLINLLHTFTIEAGQTMKQMILWCYIGFLHFFAAQIYILVTNKEAANHLWRAFKNNRTQPYPLSCG